MELQSAQGHFFSLAIDRYEFPDEELGPTEDNPADEDFWTGRDLMISCVFRNADGEWRATFPEMDTLELANLAHWIETIQNQTVTQPGVSFTEYNLEFSIDESCTILHVHTFNQFLPPWLERPASVTLNFPLAEIQLSEVLKSLHEMMQQYPGKPPLGNVE